MAFTVSYTKGFDEVEMKDDVTLLPPGEYLVTVMSVSRKASKGNDAGENAWLTLVVSKGEYTDAKVIDNISLKESAQWKMKQFLLACYEKEDFAKKNEIDLEDAIGKELRIKTFNSEYQGVERTKVQRYLPLEKKEATPQANAGEIVI